MYGARRGLSSFVALAAFAGAGSLTGCLTVGKDFPQAPVAQIHMGQTTRDDLRRMFGEPFRTGVEDGQQTWTYGYYHYSLFGSTTTRDLVLRFDDRGVVTSYTYNTTSP